MAKRMLIDATHPEETRVVVVNGTRLEQLDVESASRKQLKGTIYLAKVVRVEPSLQAAFVDYGGNRHGFLAFSEIHPDYFQIPQADREALLAARSRSDSGDFDGDDSDEDEDGDDEGAVAETVTPERRPRGRSLRDYKIQEVIKRRQIMLVQVVKEERGNKGAALTTHLSLAGRYCVLMPNTARGGGVSRKITNLTDRKRLKQIMGELDIPPTMAVILRTAGQERSKAEIKRDFEYLLRAWCQIRDTTFASTAPALIYEEANLIKRAIRDVYSADIEEVLVDGDEGYRLAHDFMTLLTPSHARKVQLYADEGMPLFQRYQVDSQLDAMHSPTVHLKSGGYIVINQTEALVAIDVNSGRATKERHIEETALKTNLEAADEIARQLRLRDLAGLVVIDFIDMEESRNNGAVERRLRDALRLDRARIQVGRISHFGLLELSRQRLRPSLMETSFEICPHCRGTGMVRSVESAAVHILRVIEEEGVRRRSAEITVSVATPVALYILNNKRAALADIEARYDFQVFLRGDDSLIVPDHQMERVKAEGLRGDGADTQEAPLAEDAVAPSRGGRGRRADGETAVRDSRRESRATAGAALVADSEAADEGAIVVADEVPEGIEAEFRPADDAEAAAGDLRKRRKRRKRRRRSGEPGETGNLEDGSGDLEGDLDSGADEDEADDSDTGDADGSGDDEAAVEAGAGDDVASNDNSGEDIVGEDGRGDDGRNEDGRRRRSRRGGRRRRRGDGSDERGEERRETLGGDEPEDEGLTDGVAGEASPLVETAAEEGIVPAEELPAGQLPAVGVPADVPVVVPAAALPEPAPVTGQGAVVAGVEAPLAEAAPPVAAALPDVVTVAAPDAAAVAAETADAEPRPARRGWWKRPA